MLIEAILARPFTAAEPRLPFFPSMRMGTPHSFWSHRLLVANDDGLALLFVQTLVIVRVQGEPRKGLSRLAFIR